jgi:hypothetical protein
MSDQPVVQAQDGVILTIGFVSGTDREAIVLPMASDASFDKPSRDQCQDAVLMAQASLLPLIQACMSPSAYIAFVQAEGMIDGFIPARSEYASSDFQGMLGGDLAPSNVTGLIVFYGDQDDLPPLSKTRSGRNFMPCVPKDMLNEDIIQPDLKTAYQALVTALIDGLPSVADSSNKWYRYMAAANPRTVDTNVIRVDAGAVRGYVCTQRRRLIPRA